MDKTGQSHLSFPRRVVYGLTIAIFSVIVFAALLEGGLRLAGFGYSSCYYRTETGTDGKSYYRENRWFVAPYFSAELIRRPQPMRIPVKKGENTYRIFVLGSSAAMGDPDASFSMSRALGAMLEDAYPAIHFEVVNAAMTAINSNVVRHIAKDCADLQPDLFIVYEGNNEVIGPFGPSAVFSPFLKSPGLISTVIALRSSRTGQMISTLAEKAGRGGNAVHEWSGMEMFLKQRIPNDDPRLESVKKIFAGNLRNIVKSGRRAGIPTLLCTVITNERDFAPFMSLHKKDLTAEQLEKWDTALAAGDKALATGNSDDARLHYREAWDIDDEYADLAFRLGRLELAAGNKSEAARYLCLARDLDALRFRTDTRLNEAVREVASTRGNTTTLVDLEKAGREASPQGIPGDNLLYEHVHLTMSGTYLIARHLFDQVSAELKKHGKIETIIDRPMTVDLIRERLAYTPYDQSMIIQEMLERFNTPPFTGQLDHAMRTLLWERRLEATNRILTLAGCKEAVLGEYENALARHPDDWVLKRNYGMALVSFGEPAKAVDILEKTREVINDDPDELFALGTAYESSGQKERADAVFAVLRKLEPKYHGLPKASKSK